MKILTILRDLKKLSQLKCCFRIYCIIYERNRRKTKAIRFTNITLATLVLDADQSRLTEITKLSKVQKC